MRNRLRAGAAALALLGSVALAATAETAAQTGSPSGTAAPGGATSDQAVQGPFNLTADAIDSFLASLAGVDTQSAPSGFKSSVGASVPKDVKTQPMPSDAKANLPKDQQDNHVAKVDDNNDNEADVILLIDPDTQQVVGMVSADGSDGPGAAPSSGGSSGAGTPSGTSK